MSQRLSAEMTDLSHNTRRCELQDQRDDSTVNAMDSAVEAVRVPVQEELKKAAEDFDAEFALEITALPDIPSSSRGQDDPTAEAMDAAETMPIEVDELEKAAQEFADDFDEMERKIHRFPAGLQGLGGRYIVPLAVAIGPYHHGLPHLRQTEKVKHVAAYHFAYGSGNILKRMYKAVVSVARRARRLYADDAVAGIAHADFAAMMLYDGCFLLQCMHVDREDMHPSLRSFFFSNRACILNDIMLLENQLPWTVVESLLKFRSVDVKKFIAVMGGALANRMYRHNIHSDQDDSFWPPHLLGLLRSYQTKTKPNSYTSRTASTDIELAVAEIDYRPIASTTAKKIPSSISIYVSAIELAEIGIKLKASKTANFMDMDIKKGTIFSELFLVPLFLDDIRACWLVNMAAFELCTAKNAEQTVVCAYLSILAMLMNREEDVHELRTKRIVQGKLTDKEMLEFFKNLNKHISGGHGRTHILKKIEAYKLERWMWIKGHAFIYNNFKTIVTVLSVIGILVGIFQALLSLKQH